MYVAFFDLDHTILGTSSGTIINDVVRREGIISKRKLRRGLYVYILYRLGLMNADAAVEQWLSLYRGISVESIRALAPHWSGRLIEAVREDARREVQRHRNNGGTTVILSASLTGICEVVRNHLDMDDSICTKLEVEDGRFTGKLEGRYCHGEEKLRRARDFCKRKGFLLEDAFYYGDSIADIHLLEAVGNPVCVTPQSKLRRIAYRRGWQISHWR